MMQQKGGFKRLIEFNPAFDKQHPDPKKNYGIHCVTMRFVLIGEKGAIQFVLYTGWYLPHNQEKILQDHLKDRHYDYPFCMLKPMPADWGCHAREPQYEGQEPIGATEVKIDSAAAEEARQNPESDPAKRLEQFGKAWKSRKTDTFRPCEYLGGAPCYYDGSGLYAEEIFNEFVEKGEDWLWERMEESYRERFESKGGDTA